MINNPVVAIVCSDIHLSMTPPIARSRETNWFEAMRRPWDEVKRVRTFYYGEHRTKSKAPSIPILCAGDIFDHWKAPPELINFAMDVLHSDMYCIPGQHDLPLHSLDDIHKSAYWTLVKAKKINNVSPEEPTPWGGEAGIDIYAFPWGVSIAESKVRQEAGRLKVALVHEYSWMDGAGFIGAPKEQKFNKRKYRGFNTVVIGDNHKRWEQKFGTTTVFNCGGFMRRKSDEVNHKPRIGILRLDGSVETHELSTTKDVLIPVVNDKPESVSANLTQFLNELKDLEGTDLDFEEMLMEAMQRENSPADVRAIIHKAIEHGRSK